MALDELESLRQVLARRRRNLLLLEERAAQYGAGYEPIEITNAIQQERAMIQRLEERLGALEARQENGTPLRTASPPDGIDDMAPDNDIQNKLDLLVDRLHVLELAVARLEVDLSTRLRRVEGDLSVLTQELKRQPANHRWIIHLSILIFLILQFLFLLSNLK